MRKGTKAILVSDLRGMVETLNKTIDRLALAEGKESTFSVAWPGDEGTKIQFQERWIQREEAEDIAAGAIWALFESRRPGDDPSCARTFDDVVERVLKIAEARCNQRPRTNAAKRDGGQRT